MAIIASTANARAHVMCCLNNGAGASVTVSARIPCPLRVMLRVPACLFVSWSLTLDVVLWSVSRILRSTPPHLHPPSTSRLLGSSCVALCNLDGTKISAAAATPDALFPNAAKVVDVLAKPVATIQSGTPTTSPRIGSTALANVDVAAELVQAAAGATPTLSPSCSTRAEAVRAAAKHVETDHSAAPTASRPPQAPGASSLVPPPRPPSSPIGDEASAQASQQLSTATTRADSLAPCLRGTRSAYGTACTVRLVE